MALDTETLEWTTLQAAPGPIGRGWTRIAATSESSFVLFGGLAGNDENPTRLDDTWECSVAF